MRFPCTSLKSACYPCCENVYCNRTKEYYRYLKSSLHSNTVKKIVDTCGHGKVTDVGLFALLSCLRTLFQVHRLNSIDWKVIVIDEKRKIWIKGS
jgi:hypothetical protein